MIQCFVGSSHHVVSSIRFSLRLIIFHAPSMHLKIKRPTPPKKTHQPPWTLTLPETNSSPLKNRPFTPKRKPDHLPTTNFQVLQYVSFRECNPYQPQPQTNPNPKFTTARPLNVDTVMGKVGFQFRRITGQGLAGPKGQPASRHGIFETNNLRENLPPFFFWIWTKKNILQRTKKTSYNSKHLLKGQNKNKIFWSVVIKEPKSQPMVGQPYCSSCTLRLWWKHMKGKHLWSKLKPTSNSKLTSLLACFFFVISHYFKDHLIVKAPSEVSKYVYLGSTITYPRYAIAHIKWVGVVGIPDPKNVIMSSRCWRASILL